VTVQNASFEVPDGTQPEITGEASEPFALIDGTFLDIEITDAGPFSRVYRWAVNDADFADIDNATANEIRDSILATPEIGFEAQSANGQVTISSIYNGSTLRVVGGQVQDDLKLSTEAVQGRTFFGPGQAWTVAVVRGYLEWAGFGASPELAVESFETGWGAGSQNYLDVFTETFEGGWDIAAISGTIEAGLFAPSNVPVETFEEGWGVNASQLFTDALFDLGLASAEDFEDGWDIVAVAPTFTDGSFAGSGVAETFEPTNLAMHVITVNQAISGIYRAFVSGTPYQIIAGAGATATTIASALATELSAGTQVNGVLAGTNRVNVAPQEPAPGIVPVITVQGPSSGSISVVLAKDAPSLGLVWVGEDINPTI